MATSSLLPGYLGKPHTVVLSYHITEGRDECILRSELMILLRYMIGKARSSIDNQIVPVLCISVRAQYLRVLEAYYDGKKMHINYGPPVHVNGGLPKRNSRNE
ncbi:hypothetical protein AJ79_08876 [Helicocarpus griseus UAMH5409]|uniref:Uncharacterized protein n=1 Tax=Helicocarpus griseus UAMH5409 TaxID=1447875 RepID=A0A2B7WNV2_9EURO|nr:hypothetical protein AJ79_08876 [Helicocarpus griseus UAMH5409]